MSSDSPSKRVRSPYPKDMPSKRSLSIEPDLPLDQDEVDEEGPAKQRQHDADRDFVRREQVGEEAHEEQHEKARSCVYAYDVGAGQGGLPSAA